MTAHMPYLTSAFDAAICRGFQSAALVSNVVVFGRKEEGAGVYDNHPTY